MKNTAKNDLIIQGYDGWEFVFRKEVDRPIKILKRHKQKGVLGVWQDAKNFYLGALINRKKLANYFGEDKI